MSKDCPYFLVLHQLEMVIHTGGKLMRIVGDIDQGLTRTLAELLDDSGGLFLMAHIQTVQRLVENDQVGIFHESTGQKH